MHGLSHPGLTAAASIALARSRHKPSSFTSFLVSEQAGVDHFHSHIIHR